MVKKLDITGMKFGRLTAIAPNGFDQSPSRKHVKWDCLCDCGAFANVRLNALRSGNIKSCGCLKSGPSPLRTHNMTGSAEYMTWHRMKRRCTQENHPDYYLYGARGIKVCDEWMQSFEAFYRDMGPKPKGMSIDRIDVNGNYCKENCRWASNHTQARNTRRNRFIEFNGVSMCITDWAKHLGICGATLHQRLKNWPLERALTTFKENQN